MTERLMPRSSAQRRPWLWMQQNLFNSWFNSLLTFVSLSLALWVAIAILSWTVTVAQWEAVTANLRLYFAGRYPVELLWRVWASLGLIVAQTGLSWGTLTPNVSLFNRRDVLVFGILALIFISLTPTIATNAAVLLVGMLVLLLLARSLGRNMARNVPRLAKTVFFAWLIIYILVLWLLQGGGFLTPVSLDNLSGLVLTLLAATASIFLSFPVGVLLALGRQSHLPVIRWLAIAYIEIIRGLPLIGILFMAQVMLPLVLPPEIRTDRVLRAILGFTLFSAAYLAENVRGGLQSVPKGQTEAAQALGLNGPLVLGLIVLPQALRAVIPTIVGQFISLFKDTSLLAIVGLVDLLGIAQSILSNPKYLGDYAEVYLFVAFIYWICCYAMSQASRRLETQLGAGQR